MVLSNKKQKQQLRAAKAELLGASAAKLNGTGLEVIGDLDPKYSHSLGILMNPMSQKPKLSKGEKRRQRPQPEKPDTLNHEEISGGAEGKKEDELKSDAAEVKPNKKRKRDKIKGSGNVKEKKEEPVKKKKIKKKTKKKRKIKNVGNEPIKDEVKVQNEGGLGGEQLLTKSDESIKRREDAELSEKVYVGGIPYYSSEDDIRSYFEHCGTITSIDCMTFPDTGKFRGIAIISFKTGAAAERALALDGSDMGGLFLKIQPFNKSAKANRIPNFAPSILEGYNRIYIGNLSWDLTEDDLRKLFCDCTIASIRFGEDKETKEFKGYAHVDFADSLSLSIALKLDQNIVCGRPVRITCAVPKNGGVNKLKSMPNYNQIESVKVSPVSEDPTSTPNNHAGNVNEGQVNSSEMNALNSKIKRRSCYVCGEKGHLSSSCPKNQATDLTNPGAVSEGQVSNVKASAFSEDKSNSSAMNVTDSKIKRRSCYLCGEKGHLSSSCLNNQAIDQTNPGAVSEAQVSSVNAFSAFSEDKGNSSALNASESKIRRRTCYECGEKGHLSSSCLKNQPAAADLSNRGAVSEDPVSKPKENQVSSVKVTADSEDKVTSSAINSKIRRRTCYECGEKGHLSSACPKIQAANPAAT